MKKLPIKTLGFIAIMFVTLSSFTFVKAQDTTTIIATYDGHDVNGFNFVIEVDDEDEDYITFAEISDELLKELDLKTDKSLIGSKFEITYKVETATEEDEDGDEQEFDVYKVVAIKKAS